MLIIQLDLSYYERFTHIPWLNQCGKARVTAHFQLPTCWLDDRMAALRSLLSTQWARAHTHAHGCLTGFLAKVDYHTFGTQWNTLHRESWGHLESIIGAQVSSAIDAGGWCDSLATTSLPEVTPEVRATIGKHMSDWIRAKDWHRCLYTRILGSLNCAALEKSFRQKFPKAPVFFEQLIEVYEAGRLPCGWEGNVDDWPHGSLVVH